MGSGSKGGYRGRSYREMNGRKIVPVGVDRPGKELVLLWRYRSVYFFDSFSCDILGFGVLLSFLVSLL